MGDYADDAIEQGFHEMLMRENGELEDFEDEDPMGGTIVRHIRKKKVYPLTPLSAFYGWERVD